MAQLKHIATNELYTVAENPVFNSGIWECGDQRFTDQSGDEYEVVRDIQAIIKFSYPTAAAKTASIVVDVVVVDRDDNTLPISETYYVPLYNVSNPGNEAMAQMLVVELIAGVGQVSFSVDAAGIYSIKSEMIRPLPTAQFSVMPDMAIY